LVPGSAPAGWAMSYPAPEDLGAPANMRNAIVHYNDDYDYADAVDFFARAFRADPQWLDRMYYWNTTG